MIVRGTSCVLYALVALLAWSGTCSYAAPTVDVALQAAFPAPPFLIELLETAAGENATSYFPILDRIADGHFDESTTDKDLYEAFLSTLEDDGHLQTAEELSAFKLALSIHSAAPRIEAHYQFYNTTAGIARGGKELAECEAWVAFNGKRYCDPELSGEGTKLDGPTDGQEALPFDRVIGTQQKTDAILYADLTSPAFRKFHKTVSATAKSGKTSYRLRYKPPKVFAGRPLSVSGFGVELALKRTDYIVIDDRAEGDTAKVQSKQPGQSVLSDEDQVADLKPLSSSELASLSLKAASFVMASKDKLSTLLKLSQDFPKHSGGIAAAEVDEALKVEAQKIGQTFIPPGYNALWINGQQLLSRDLDIFSLLGRLRKERKLIDAGTSLGIFADDVVKLISQDDPNQGQIPQDSVQRFDWRDDIEGNNVIIWMNNIEKDRRYQDWPDVAQALLQRTFPGQLPAVRKDIHNVILPVDFSDKADVALVMDNIQAFVQRKVPVRFGIVPRTSTAEATQTAKLIYYIIDTYELAYALKYLELALPDLNKGTQSPSRAHFETAIKGVDAKETAPILSFGEITSTESSQERIVGVKSYLRRLAADGPSAPYIINGVPIENDEDWMQSMSNRVSMDMRIAQQGVYTGTIDESTWIAGVFLQDASTKRNTLIIPQSEKDTRFINLADFPEFSPGTLDSIPRLPASDSTVDSELVQLVVVADLNDVLSAKLVRAAADFRADHDNVELFFAHSGLSPVKYGMTGPLYDKLTSETPIDIAALKAVADEAEQPHPAEYALESEAVQQFWKKTSRIVQAVSPALHTASLILNGRVVNGIADRDEFTADDFDMLLSYERKKRLAPTTKALKTLDLVEAGDSPYGFARLSNLIALSKVSDEVEGIFETPPSGRMSIPQNVKTDHSSFSIGDPKKASIQIVANIDPASQTAQKWLPTIKTLSEMAGVYTKIILSPKTKLDELPIKRFYRKVLNSTPSFDASGNLLDSCAHFSGLPTDALLTIGMDLPPAWLVSPKDSVHDLDNLRIGSLKTDEIKATYQLDNILIEGHSKEAGTGSPPRGAQLVLSTGNNDRVADTIIMANIGYFQFKANPGYYNLSLQKGRSQEIFNIDSTGNGGGEGDKSTQIALLSFSGTTLYPTLSRRVGMEKEDVLEPSKSSLEKTMDTLSETAGGVMNVLGLSGKDAGNWLSKASQKVIMGSSSKAVSTLPHADINIFSVASGHLYERMLNIMMVSVMKHTSHTVKFWFIEQFLSPSFKSFLPLLAEEYGFKYEMVTYKWPHWLRGQTEKQREIWGYKILFLDVLFPLDLDKVIFVDADQIVRTDMYELVQYDLKGAPYGFTPMCDSRTEMEGFRFWKQGYWANFLRGLPYHISALYVVDLAKFRQMAAGDRLRQQYHQLSADPESLSNLDQDLPNHMQHVLPIHSLPQEWLWCETWCSDESLGVAKTIDLCNNPQTKEPKLERARRQVPEWTIYDDEIAALGKRKQGEAVSVPGRGDGTGEQEMLQAEEYRRKLEEEKAKLAGKEGSPPSAKSPDDDTVRSKDEL